MAISTQYQNLNLIPGKSAPVVVHCSQGNVGDTVGFYLYDGDEPFYPTNVSIAVHGVRADGSVFGPYTVAVTSGSNLVTFELVTAMTSVAGAAIGELVITDSGENQVGTANFGILVETTPYSSTVTYEDDLSIYQRILAYVQSIPASISGQIAAEASTREEADDELEQLINTEISNRQSAVTSLTANLSTESSERAAADANLQSQINQIVSPSGEAPSAAEVQNARIGADGVTYGTLGDAIRTQFKNETAALKSLIDTTAINLLAFGSHTNITRSGITFSFNSDGSCTVTGTATGTAYCDYYTSTTAIPDWLELGKTYRVIYSNSAVSFRVYGVTSGNISTIYSSNASGTFTIPTTINGIIIRIAVDSGITVSTTVDPILLLTYTNEEIYEKALKRIEVSNGSSYSNLATNLPSGTFAYVLRSWFTDTSDIEFINLSSAVMLVTFGNTANANVKVQLMIDAVWGYVLTRRVINGTATDWKDVKNGLHDLSKKYFAFGDSLMWGALWSDNGGSVEVSQADYEYRIPTRIALACGFNYFRNYAVGGMAFIPHSGSVSQSMLDCIKSYDLSDAGLITVAGGRNDSVHPLGTAAGLESGTICEAIDEILSYLTTTYKKAQIVWIEVTPSTNDNTYVWTGNNVGGWNQNDFEEQVGALCASYGVPFISWKDCTYCWHWADFVESQYGTAHPNTQEAFMQMGNYCGGKIASYYKS